MKPVAIFRHSPSEGPGYFATFLEAHRIPWRLIAIDIDDAIPQTPAAFSGLAFMGGPMSVNDSLMWIEPVCHLIRTAVHNNVPVIGHCLGGQLFSKALGGTVCANPVKEIGWSTLAVEDGAIARDWLGDAADADGNVTAFQWHGETFSVPPGATKILRNSWCENQAVVLGPHLAMQCHVEMTPALIRTWCEAWHSEINSAKDRPACVQTLGEIDGLLATNVPKMRRVADQLYRRWTGGLTPG